MSEWPPDPEHGASPADSTRPIFDDAVFLMGLASFVVGLLSGVGSDRVDVPTAKKCALTVFYLVTVALVRVRLRTFKWFKVAVTFWAVLSVFTMWYWN